MNAAHNLRRLAAIDIVFLGFKLIFAEFLCGAVLSTALGIFVLIRSHSAWTALLGTYLLGLGANYVPMVTFALSISNRESARVELADELTDARPTMSKYRRVALLLLVPFLVPVLVLTRKQQR